MKLGEQLEQLKGCRNNFKALEQNNYSKAENIAFKQQILIERQQIIIRKPSLELENNGIGNKIL